MLKLGFSGKLLRCITSMIHVPLGNLILFDIDFQNCTIFLQGDTGFKKGNLASYVISSYKNNYTLLDAGFSLSNLIKACFHVGMSGSYIYRERVCKVSTLYICSKVDILTILLALRVTYVHNHCYNRFIIFTRLSFINCWTEAKHNLIKINSSEIGDYLPYKPSIASAHLICYSAPPYNHVSCQSVLGPTNSGFVPIFHEVSCPF